jgi:CRP-like cAMP-binding protein
MPFTQGLDPKHLRKLATMTKEVNFMTGEIIFREGDEGTAIYLIGEGQVTLEAHVEGKGLLTFHVLGPQDLLGWSALFPPRRKAATAKAVKPTRAVAIDAGQLLNAFRSNKALEIEIMRRMGDVIAERLKKTRAQLLNNTIAS